MDINSTTSQSDADEPMVIITRHSDSREPPAKPRLFYNGKDILYCLLPLVVVIIFIVWLTGNIRTPWSHNNSQGNIPHYRADIAISAAAGQFHLPFRYPHLPHDWITNAGRKDTIGPNIVIITGWVTPRRNYIEMSQSSADKTMLLNFVADNHSFTKISKITSDYPQWEWYKTDSGTTIVLSSFSQISVAFSTLGDTESLQTIIKAYENTS